MRVKENWDLLSNFEIMNMEDIQKTIAWSEYVLKCLQELADDLIKVDIVPTIGKLISLFNGGSLWELEAESCENQGISRMPSRIQERMREDAEKELDKIRLVANSIINNPDTIEWDLYSVKRNGKVIISEDYKERIASRFDDGAKILLDAYELFRNVKEQRIGVMMREQNKTYSQAKEEIERILAVFSIPKIKEYE